MQLINICLGNYILHKDIFNVLSYETAGPHRPGPLEHCHQSHPIVTPLPFPTFQCRIEPPRSRTAFSNNEACNGDLFAPLS
jgi:hypothetical protein